jgi:hypothetical protein
MWRWIFSIHVVILILCFPAFFVGLRRRLGHQLKNPWSLEPLRDLFAFVPRWMLVAAVITVAYAFVNFARCIELNQGGSPDVQNGRFVLTVHGSVIRTITENAYEKAMAVEARAFSGLWLLFSWLAALAFTYELRRRAWENDPRSCSG